MRKFIALELDDSDIDRGRFLGLTNDAAKAVAGCEIVTYRGEIVKNRNGEITKTLRDVATPPEINWTRVVGVM